MVLDQIIFGTAIVGSGVAAAYDLKTTEVPDWVFYAMLIVGVPAVIAKIFFGGSFDAFIVSGLTGLGLFGFGYMMYRIGQWGGADMALLGLVGFMMPSVSLQFPAAQYFPFGLSYLFNVFVLGSLYMVVYAIAYALRNKGVTEHFKVNVKASSKMILIVFVSMLILFTAVMLYLNSLVSNVFTDLEILRGILVPTVLAVAFLFVYRLAKSVENFGFRKKVPVSQLKVGDMLLEERKLVGVTRDQIRKIKKSKVRFVWIKDGVRFAPTFPIALLFTLFVGDAILLIRFLI